MTDEVKPEVIKKTQEVLGKFIKKPTLTEKLLKKPPFRFLHDICTSVMKETGFLEQVLGPEDKIENIKDKEGKIEFLEKVIAAVEAVIGIKLTVKPNKVVAGLEATKTNEFLQAIGKAVEKQQLEKKSSKATLHAKTKSTNKAGKEEPPDKKKTSNRTKKIVENGFKDATDVRDKTDAELPTLPKRKRSSKKPEFANLKEKEDEKLKDKALDNGFVEKQEESVEEKAAKSSAHGAVESEELLDVNMIKMNGDDGQRDEISGGKKEILQGEEEKSAHSGKQKHRRSSFQTVSEQNKLVENSEGNKNIGGGGDSVANGINNLNQISQPNISESQDKTTPSPTGQIKYSKNSDVTLFRENTIISRPRTGIRPTTARPASARPAAPRIRDRGDITVTEEIIKPASGKVQVIVDEETVNDADDENLILLEAPNDIGLQESMPISVPGESVTEYEHGHLVEQILEAQRELEDDTRFSEQKVSGKTLIEWESNKRRQSANREIENLRANIQNLTRTANPLGKLLDFFQEDIEIVQKELESWKEKNASYRLQIAQEKSITEQYVEPLKIHLMELQKSIDEQVEQISVVKGNIIRNNEKIYKLLSGL